MHEICLKIYNPFFFFFLILFYSASGLGKNVLISWEAKFNFKQANFLELNVFQKRQISLQFPKFPLKITKISLQWASQIPHFPPSVQCIMPGGGGHSRIQRYAL